MVDGEPLSPIAARQLISRILSKGSVVFSSHARKEGAKDGLDIPALEKVLRSGAVQQGEWENGEWRYQVRAGKSTIVISFESDEELTVITAWRERR